MAVWATEWLRAAAKLVHRCCLCGFLLACVPIKQLENAARIHTHACSHTEVSKTCWGSICERHLPVREAQTEVMVEETFRRFVCDRSGQVFLTHTCCLTLITNTHLFACSLTPTSHIRSPGETQQLRGGEELQKAQGRVENVKGETGRWKIRRQTVGDFITHYCSLLRTACSVKMRMCDVCKIGHL